MALSEIKSLALRQVRSPGSAAEKTEGPNERPECVRRIRESRRQRSASQCSEDREHEAPRRCGCGRDDEPLSLADLLAAEMQQDDEQSVRDCGAEETQASDGHSGSRAARRWRASAWLGKEAPPASSSSTRRAVAVSPVSARATAQW